MTNTQAVRELAALPPEAKRVVLDLIVVLRTHEKPVKLVRKTKRPPLEREKFIGLWRNRKEMADSTAWVRSLRQREWSR